MHSLQPLKQIVVRDPTQIVVAKPPLIGYIKTGTKNPKSGKGMPLDYFHLKPASNTHADAIAQFEQSQGKNPSEIFIYFHTSDLDTIAVHQHEAKINHQKVAYSDGELVAMLHPTKGIEVVTRVEEIKKLPLSDPLRKQWDYINARELWETKLTLSFFLKGYRGLGWFKYITQGENIIANIFARLNSVKAMLGRFDKVLFKMHLSIGQKPGTPYKYNAVDLIPYYSPEQMFALAKAIRSGQLDLDKCGTWMEVEEYVQLNCPDQHAAQLNPYTSPNYNGEMDVKTIGGTAAINNDYIAADNDPDELTDEEISEKLAGIDLNKPITEDTSPNLFNQNES